MFTVVLLPDPFGPRYPRISPRCTVKLTRSTARKRAVPLRELAGLQHRDLRSREAPSAHRRLRELPRYSRGRRNHCVKMIVLAMTSTTHAASRMSIARSRSFGGTLTRNGPLGATVCARAAVDNAIEIDTRTTIGSRVRIHCAVRLRPRSMAARPQTPTSPLQRRSIQASSLASAKSSAMSAGEVFVEAAGIQAQDRAVDNAGDGRCVTIGPPISRATGRAATRLARAVRTSVSIRSTSTLSAARPDLVSW